MRHIVLVLAIFGGVFCAKNGLAQQAPVLVITNTNVVPLNKNIVLSRQTVLIKKGRIQQIGDADKVRIPQGAIVVKGDNKYLLPGLIDMHAHLPGPEGMPHSLDTYFRLNLASGVTGLRSMRGDTSHLRWRDSLRRTAARAPHLYLGSPVFTRDKAYSARKGQRLLSRYKASGYDFVKYLGGMSAPQFDSLLTDAHQLSLKVAGHAPKSGLRGAIAAGMTSVEHIEPFIEAYRQDSVQFRELARQMAVQGIYTCPDLYWYKVTWLQYSPEQLQQLPGLKYINSKLRGEWQTSQAARIQQLTSQNALTAAHAQITVLLQTYQRAFRIMHQAGVKFLISPGDGNFVVPGFGMAEELTLLVQQGLSPYEALQAATINAAACLGEQDQRGTVVSGKVADLMLLDANPLTDIANVRRVNGVVVDGRWMSVGQLLPAPQ